MNPLLQSLHPYPFEKLAKLYQGLETPELPPINFGIGEPQHPSPAFIQQAVIDNIALMSKYPTTLGIPELRQSIARWIGRRYGVKQIDPDTEIVPVMGTREALFAIAQVLLDRSQKPLVLTPNPFYQIYEGATLLAGGEPVYLSCTAEHGFQPDFDAVSAETWQRCQLLYICSPGNPTGAVLSFEQLKKLIALADQYDFTIVSDECYADIYFDEAPIGLLEACEKLGRTDFSRCLIFQSLSKRSNLPGMRSGFVAGDAKLIKPFLLYRTYQGCALPIHHQLASIAAWGDDQHAEDNRVQYRAKFKAVTDILKDVLPVEYPDAGFYLWLKVPGSDEDFARELKRQQNVTLLPGQYLSREVDGENPGYGRVRVALVATLEECVEGANRIRTFLQD